MNTPYWKLCLYAILVGALIGYTFAQPQRAAALWARGLGAAIAFGLYAGGQWLWRRVKS
jgi:hypothetical protein